ncbi:MAG: phytanoyl-CoA dioxygenase family protein, partial [Candidatus Poribacteria bacterium]|nr:phytanoyl-CoA dioxygenase family protein [Candidatus Poribacteria bacterium]
MDKDTMTLEENYAFDIGGYLIIRNALTPQQLDGLNRTLDAVGRSDGMLGWETPHREPFRDLLVHPLLVFYLNQICGNGFRLEGLPRLVDDDAGDATGRLQGGNEPRDPARAYYYQNGRRQCQSVMALWALANVNEGDGGLVLVPCSHKSNVETPEELLSGKDDMRLVVQPALKAGDLLLYAETLTHGWRSWRGKGEQRLLQYGFAARGAVLNAGTGDQAAEMPIPDWMVEMPEEQRAAVYKPGFRDTNPPPTLISDGKTNRIAQER